MHKCNKKQLYCFLGKFLTASGLFAILRNLILYYHYYCVGSYHGKAKRQQQAEKTPR